MSTSNLTYKDYSFGDHGEVYQILEKVFAKHQIKYCLVGANARDVHLYKAGIKPTRLTGDIDFAVMVPDFEIYDTLFDELCALGFKRTNERYRLVYEKTDTIIDLMPYGEIEEEYTVNFTDRDLSLSVLGFKEVSNHAEEIRIDEAGFSVPTTPIEGLIILKLVAWNDKPMRIKDLDDVSFLISNAWEIYQEEAYTSHLDIFEDEDFKMTTAAARIIGRKNAANIITERNITQNNSPNLGKSHHGKTQSRKSGTCNGAKHE